MQGRGILAVGITAAAILVTLTMLAALAIQAAPSEPAKAPPATPTAAPAPTPTVAPAPTATAPAATATAPATTTTAAGGAKLVPLNLSLPKPLFMTTPKNIKADEHMEPISTKPPEPLMIPEGCTNLALKKPVTSSDTMPIIGELSLVTDGDKDGAEGCYVELAPGKQWIQIDLGQAAQIFAIAVWHYHGEARVYHDVVVQVSDDPDFIQKVQTVFNNDYDNSSGLGVGKDLEYVESYRGHVIDAKGVTGRYVRLYSNTNTSNDQSHYIEVEVYGKPVK